jgi:hypothetical protein
MAIKIGTLSILVLVMVNLFYLTLEISPCFPTNYPFGSYGTGGDIIYYDFDVKPDGTSIVLGGSCNDASICVLSKPSPII